MINIFTFWIALLPLITWQSRYEVPKVFWLLSGGISIIVFFILNYEKLVINNRDKWYLFWLISLFISGVFGEDFKLSLLGGSYRHQGVVFFVCLWLIIKILEIFDSEKKELLYKCVGLTVVFESLVVLSGSKIGTIGDINAVSGFLVIGIFFIYKYLPKWLIFFPVVAMFVDFSKSGFLAFSPYIYSKKYIFPIILFLIYIFIYKPINLNSPFENRSVIWNHSFNLILKSPLLGYGAESNEKLFDKAFYESGFPLSNLIVDRAHNLFLDITLWSGIVGLIFFSMFLFASFKKLDIDHKKVFLSFLIFSMFQPLSVAHWLLFILII